MVIGFAGGVGGVVVTAGTVMAKEAVSIVCGVGANDHLLR